MMATSIGDGAYKRFLEYMEHAKKPKSMNPAKLSIRVGVLCGYATYLLRDDGTPGPEIPELKIRQFYLRCCPHSWVQQFENAGKTAATTTLPQMVASYMNIQFKHEPVSTKRSGNGNGANAPKRIKGGGGNDAQRGGNGARGGRGGGG